MAETASAGRPSEQLNVAREELEVLEALATGVLDQIANLYSRPRTVGQLDHTELSLIEHKHGQLKAYEELADNCYGRTVVGTEVDERDQLKAAFTYRITQANVGFVEGNCFVLARNSPLATELVTAQPGDEREIITRTKERYLKVKEVRTFDGPTSLRSPSEEPNFRLMAIRRGNLKAPLVVEDLRAALRRISSDQANEAPRPVIEISRFHAADPTWLINWSGVYLSDSDEQSLSHQFITRTTVDQERALNNPRGLTFVEGIAGAGKTSVALGRLKFFANFATGAEREYYGLQNAPQNDFSPVGMMGFVLSHSLKRYLKDAASALGMGNLPIRDFEEFRADLSDRFGIANRFRKKKGVSNPLRCKAAWLRALDAAMARVAGMRIRENLTQAGSVPAAVVDELTAFVSQLSQAETQPSGSFHLSGLIDRVVTVVVEAELREQENLVSAKFAVRETLDNERRRREELNLEREMRRIQERAERRIVSPLADKLISGLTSYELFPAAVVSEQFSALVSSAFSGSSESVPLGLKDAVTDIKNLVSQPEERLNLTEADLIALIIFAALMADGFDYLDQSGAQKLYQIRKHTAVFIDEVQDFTEIEIVLMGMSVTGAYNQITLCGDRCQQLQPIGATDFDGLFPWILRSSHNRSVFLDYNFRQRPELATLSSGFRSLILGDARLKTTISKGHDPAAIYQFHDRDRWVEFVLKRVHSLPHHATVALVVPTLDEAQVWFDLLEEDLNTYHRPALLSRRDDLTKRVNIHFTSARETKGLEFDAVIVPDLGSFELDARVGRNQLYVALTRARQSLLIGCAADSIRRPEIESLGQAGLVKFSELPSH
jgi:UvrD-like helicase C-terminal domain